MNPLLYYESAKHLHQELFSEEHDSIYLEDDGWSEEHTSKLNRKRCRLAVSPISSHGSTTNESALDFCEREIKAAQSNQVTEYTAIALDILREIKDDKQKRKYELEARLTIIKGIDPENPSTWTDTMINNSYKLMAAVDRWELDTPMPFEKFKEKIFKNKNLARKHAPRGKMDEEDYNPWATS